MSTLCSKCGNVENFFLKNKWEKVGECGNLVLLLNHETVISYQQVLKTENTSRKLAIIN
jgi:hypothetical protein